MQTKHRPFSEPELTESEQESIRRSIEENKEALHIMATCFIKDKNRKKEIIMPEQKNITERVLRLKQLYGHRITAYINKKQEQTNKKIVEYKTDIATSIAIDIEKLTFPVIVEKIVSSYDKNTLPVIKGRDYAKEGTYLYFAILIKDEPKLMELWEESEKTKQEYEQLKQNLASWEITSIREPQEPLTPFVFTE